MLGMEMMFKALGLDPQTMLTTIQNLGKMAVELKEQLDRIEQKQNDINQTLEALCAASPLIETEKHKIGD